MHLHSPPHTSITSTHLQAPPRTSIQLGAAISLSFAGLSLLEGSNVAAVQQQVSYSHFEGYLNLKACWKNKHEARETDGK